MVLLIDFDIDYVVKKVVKGRRVANFLAQNLVDDGQEWELKFPDEHLGVIEIQGWSIYFDGAFNNKGADIRVILVKPEEEMIPTEKRLEFDVTNNQAEYEAYIFRLEALRSLGVE